MPWSTSTRRATLPLDWAHRVEHVKRRDRGRCQWPTEDGTCGRQGRDVDHRVDRLDHRLDSLWLLCGQHHDAKTAAEAAAARWPERQRREPEAHPGVLPARGEGGTPSGPPPQTGTFCGSPCVRVWEVPLEGGGRA